jgi:hypothetical protein
MEEKFNENFLEDDTLKPSKAIDWNYILSKNSTLCINETREFKTCLNKTPNRCKQIEFILTKCLGKSGLILN